MRLNFFAAAACVGCLAGTTFGTVINDGSFEMPVLPDDGYVGNVDLSSYGFVVTATDAMGNAVPYGAGLTQVNDVSNTRVPTGKDGVQFAEFVNGGNTATISQTLRPKGDNVIAAFSTYMLSAHLGISAPDAAIGYSSAGATLELLDGTTGAVLGTPLVIPGAVLSATPGVLVTYSTLPITVLPGSASIGHPLELELIGAPGAGPTETVFDDFTISVVTPEPASLSLLTLGSIGLLARRRR